MADYLVFTLIAPMGSFGGLAGHEQRGSHHFPGRSAILGLLGAAFGIRRHDRQGQEALRVWKTAVGAFEVGEAWQDFHTVQTVPSARIKRPTTRKDAIAALHRSDNGLITRRSYHSDCVFKVALWGGDLDAACAALRQPFFVPYLGRKSCPLSAPMAPKIVTMADPVEALKQAVVPDFIGLSTQEIHFIASDEPIGPDRTETRWDDPLDREDWHFGQRQVYIHVPGDAP
ncbi:MAG: type I-E CRISPR-associated protein Cas5/CasD [Pseudomonadota bacterium]